MKKTVSLLLILALVAAAFSLVSCGGSPEETGSSLTDDTGSGAQTTGAEEINVPDVTLEYVAAELYADAKTAEGKDGIKVADNASISKWYKDSTEFDADFNIVIPEEFSKLDGYVFRIAIGQYIEEVSVFKVSNAEDVEAVKALAEYRCSRQKSNEDFKLYDDENGTNAKMMESGKVAAFGNFVVYAVTQNTEVSMLRAQKFAQENPDATPLEMFYAIASELK